MVVAAALKRRPVEAAKAEDVAVEKVAVEKVAVVVVARMVTIFAKGLSAGTSQMTSEAYSPDPCASFKDKFCGVTTCGGGNMVCRLWSTVRSCAATLKRMPTGWHKKAE